MASIFSNNISYYTIPLCWFIALLPRQYSAAGYTKATGKKGLDSRQPRDLKDTITNDPALDSATRGRLLRAEATIANAFENLPLFAAAVTAGNSAGLSSGVMNTFSVGYIASRIVYSYVYINGETIAFAAARSILYLGQIAGLMFVFVKSGMQLNSS